MKKVELSSLFSVCLFLACIPAGKWIPLPVEGAKIFSTYSRGDTIELEIEGMIIQANGGWGPGSSFITIFSNNTEKSVRIDVQNVTLRHRWGRKRVQAGKSEEVWSDKLLRLTREEVTVHGPGEESVYAKRVAEAGSEDSYLATFPVEISPGTSAKFWLNFERPGADGMHGLLSIPLLTDGEPGGGQLPRNHWTTSPEYAEPILFELPFMGER